MLVFALLTSCVSSKKYNELLSAKQQTEEAFAVNSLKFQNTSNELNAEIKKLKQATSQQLAAKQKELEAKEQLLASREQTLNELKEMMNRERNAIQNLKKEVCDALKCFTPDELTVEVREGKLYVSMSDKLLFPSGSDVVNERGREAVEMLSAVLTNSSMEIMVEGHTDNVPISNGRNKDNWDLSAHRATSVARIMIEEGIAAERIIASGRGEFHQIATNTTPEGKQKNRRTEIVLAPRLDKLWKLTEQGDDNISSSAK